jgi:hypothetical protein
MRVPSIFVALPLLGALAFIGSAVAITVVALCATCGR